MVNTIQKKNFFFFCHTAHLFYLLYQMIKIVLNLFDYFSFIQLGPDVNRIIYIDAKNRILRLIRDTYAYNLQIVSEMDFFHSGLKA